MSGFMDAYNFNASNAPANFVPNFSNVLEGGFGLGYDNSLTNPTPFNNSFQNFSMGNSSPGFVPGATWLDKMKADLGNGMEGFGQGISAFSNLANIYAGFKSLGLAKDQLQFAKSSFNKNFNAQAQAYNNELRDRWEARSNAHATRGRTYEGMDSWLAGRQIESTGRNRDRVNSAQP